MLYILETIIFPNLYQWTVNSPKGYRFAYEQWTVDLSFCLIPQLLISNHFIYIASCLETKLEFRDFTQASKKSPKKSKTPLSKEGFSISSLMLGDSEFIFVHLPSSPQRRFSLVYDLENPGGYKAKSKSVSEYKLGLLPRISSQFPYKSSIDQ